MVSRGSNGSSLELLPGVAAVLIPECPVSMPEWTGSRCGCGTSSKLACALSSLVGGALHAPACQLLLAQCQKVGLE